MKLRSPLTLVGIRGPFATVRDATGDDDGGRGTLDVAEHARDAHARLVRATAFLRWLDANPGTGLDARESEARYQRELDRLGIDDDDVDDVSANPWFLRAADGSDVTLAAVMFLDDNVLEWLW